MSVYIAAPLPRYRHALTARDALQAAHLTVLSSWIDRAVGAHEGAQEASYSDILEWNLKDLRSCQHMLLLTFEKGGGEMFVELGRFLETVNGPRPRVVSCGHQRVLSQFSKFVIHAPTVDHAVGMLKLMEGVRR